jgi:hypothetical protein
MPSRKEEEIEMFRNAWRSFAAAAFVVGAFADSAAGQAAAPPVPDKIKVPAGNTMFLKGSATGTQNYVCLPGESGLEWVFQAPQATVFMTIRWFTGDYRQQVTTHYLSPNPEEAMLARATWQSSIDTSTVWAKKIAEADAAPGAIPWFLLQVTGRQRGPEGGVSLMRTTYIQRINTTGGVKPATTCDKPGALEFVPYTAEYVFYQPVSN